jgi:hypothetical protein
MAYNTTLEVRMNEAKIGLFHSGPYKCIGTQHLNGCTAVTIVSPYAAILAHIAPRDPRADPRDFNAGDNNCRAKMNEVIALYRQNIRLFPPNVPTWIISAMYRGEPALPDQRRIIEERLQQEGLVYANTMYLVLDSTHPRGPEKGTVLVDARRGEQPIIYVEGKAVN